MFRRVLDTARKAMGLPVTHHFDDPVISRMPHTAPVRSRRFRRGKLRFRDVTKPTMACDPGTIVYHDKLVKHFGRRKAEGYRIARQLGHMSCLPTEQDFINNPPWAFLK